MVRGMTQSTSGSSLEAAGAAASAYLAMMRRKKKRCSLIMMAMSTSGSRDRLSKHGRLQRTQMVWAQRFAQLNERQFKQRYRLDKVGFTELAKDIEEGEIFYELKEEVRMTKKIPIEIKLSATLRFLAGGSYVDIIDLHGISQTAFYSFLPCVCLAISNHPKYTIDFPIDDEEKLEVIADGFATVRVSLSFTFQFYTLH
jgi:hypothetical protein